MDSATISHADPMYKRNKSASVSHADKENKFAAVSHAEPMYKGSKSAAVSPADKRIKSVVVSHADKGIKSVVVSHADKGNKSAVENEEKVRLLFRKRKSVADEGKVRKIYIPLSFRKSVADEEKVRKNYIPLSFRKSVADEDKVWKNYIPLSFRESEKVRGSYIPLSVADEDKVWKNYIPLSFRKSEKVRESYIPLSFYTTTDYHRGPIMTKVNKSSKSKIRNDSVGSTAVSKVSESKVSRNSIPDKVALSILSKLSIKSLKRFGCVSKSYSILFENSDFMTMYTNHFISRHGADDGYHTFLLTNHLLYHADDHHVPNFTKHASLYTYKGKLHLPDNRLKLNVPSPFQQSYHDICILGSTSVNGIFCFGKDYSSAVNNVKYVLSNPATDEFLVIPPSLAELKPRYPENGFHLLVDFHGFGYDQVRHDFKLIQHVSFHHDDCESKRFLEIYSLKSHSWRMINVKFDLPSWFFPPSFNGCELYVNGACHWLAQKCINYKHVEITLVSFDMSDELFLTTPIGEESYSPYTYHRRLAVLNGSIALISNYDSDIIFHISILGELGVTQSWTKLYVYGPLPSIYWPPIGFGKTGYIFFRNKDEELAYVDLSTQLIDEVGGITGEKGICMVGLYKESFLSIGGIK